MIDPVQFLIAATLSGPGGPFLAIAYATGLLAIIDLAFGPGRRGAARTCRPRTPVPPTDEGHAPPIPAAHLAQVKIDCVPVLDPARADLLERLEDAVECLGRAQRVLPDIMLSRALRIRADPAGNAHDQAVQRAMTGTGLDFGVFSYAGQLDLALMVVPADGAEAKTDRQLIEIALERAGVPLIAIALDVSAETLRARIRSVRWPVAQQPRAA